MRVFLLIGSVLGAALLSGCNAGCGYYAPPYKATVIGCVPAFVPAR